MIKGALPGFSSGFDIKLSWRVVRTALEFSQESMRLLSSRTGIKLESIGENVAQKMEFDAESITL